MSGIENNNRVLIVEDDHEIAKVVALNLEDSGLEPELAADGRTGLELAQSGAFALVILDIMLPEMDGITVCKTIRERDPYTPILMLTAKAEEIDRILGLEIGADDYLTKPFSMRELLARVKALLRRSRTLKPSDQTQDSAGNPPEDEILQIGKLKIDFKKHKAELSGIPLDLTLKEFELLALFAGNPGRAYRRSDLLRLVWGYNFEGYEHTVNTHINRLRNKLEKDPSKPDYLLTVWGIGYRFAEASEVPQ